MSGSVGATFINTILLASKIPVRNPWLNQCIKGIICMSEDKLSNYREMNVNLENCPIIAGMDPLYTPRNPTSGSFEIISGKLRVDACTRV